MRWLSWVFVASFVIAVGCGGNAGFEGCGDIRTQCAPSVPCDMTECSFEPSAIDCTTACQNFLAVCNGGCGDVSCGETTLEECVESCTLTTTDSCGNATFGCYTLNSACTAIAGCLICS